MSKPNKSNQQNFFHLFIEIETLHRPNVGETLGPLPTLVKSTTITSNSFNNADNSYSVVKIPEHHPQNQSRIITIPEFSFTTSGSGGGQLGGNSSFMGSNSEEELGDLLLGLPPLITHTAATPQGSPPNGPHSVATLFEAQKSKGNESRLNRSSLSINVEGRLNETEEEGVTNPNRSHHHRSMVSFYDFFAFCFLVFLLFIVMMSLKL